MNEEMERFRLFVKALIIGTVIVFALIVSALIIKM